MVCIYQVRFLIVYCDLKYSIDLYPFNCDILFAISKENTFTYTIGINKFLQLNELQLWPVGQPQG